MSNIPSNNFTSHSRQPRVRIDYDNRMAGLASTHLPFVVGVLANLSGKPAEPLPPILKRSFVEINAVTFDDIVKSMKPRVAFRVPNTVTGEGELRVDLTFECLDDFSPSAIAKRMVPLSQIFADRNRLATLLCYIDGMPRAEDWIARLLADEDRMRALAGTHGDNHHTTDTNTGLFPTSSMNADNEVSRMGSNLSDKQTLCDAFWLKAQSAQKAMADEAIRALARLSLERKDLIGTDAVKSVNAMIDAMDQILAKQINKIIHHHDFKSLEGTWRGLRYLVSRTETDETLKIKILNLPMKDLSVAIMHCPGLHLYDSPIFKKICHEPFSTPGADMFGCIVGDYEFDHSDTDIRILSGMSQIAAAAHTPFITGAAPSLLELDSWSELRNIGTIASRFSAPTYLRWRNVRESEESKYICLTLPRFLARAPYDVKNSPAVEFGFTEQLNNCDETDGCWANSAYAMAANITRAFRLYGWFARLHGHDSGGRVEDLTCAIDECSSDQRRTVGPIEAVVDRDQIEAELASSGLAAICGTPGERWATFQSAPSLYSTLQYEDIQATRVSRLLASLPYTFAACRFAHYVQAIARDTSFKKADDLSAHINAWLCGYVDPDPNADDARRAKRPLLAANFEVIRSHESGSLWCELNLRPEYQLPISSEMRFNLLLNLSVD